MIPWDDDIDVFMPRPDYDRFIEIASTTNLGDYELVTPFNKDDYPLYFAKLCQRHTTLQEEADTPCVYGLYIDIFPIDGAPSDDAEYARLREKMERWNRFLFYKLTRLAPRFRHDKVLWAKTIVWKLMLLPLPFSAIQRHIHALATSHDFETSEMSDKLSFPNPGNTRMYRSVFEHYIDVEFEGHLFKAPRDYDVYQRAIYGDYMQLPPEEERHPHHGFHAYWK